MEPGFTLSFREVVAGIIVIGGGFGGGLVGLIKLGLINIKIGKSNNKPSEGNPVAKIEYDSDACKDRHKRIDANTIAYDKMTQTMILEQRDHKNTLEVHKEELKKGSKRMDTMQKEIGHVDLGVALLLDRSPGGDTRQKR